MKVAGLSVHQIFYDDATRSKLDPGFLPLNNTANERPDWYELWPIRKFLHNAVFEEGAWYGFLSTSFRAKTGLTATHVFDIVSKVGAQSDVVLFSPGWDQIAYFRNVFEQGDIFHPGLAEVSQRFLTHLGVDLDLGELVTHSLSSVFSNYVVARGAYWRRWLDLADALFDYAEGVGADHLANGTRYRGGRGVHMKAFVQERLSAVVLARDDFRVFAHDLSATAPIGLFHDGLKTRLQLRRCDELKRLYCRTSEKSDLENYYALRAAVPLARAVPGLNAPRSTVT